jgi:transcriptional regulator with XRE-family HTH domain
LSSSQPDLEPKAVLVLDGPKLREMRLELGWTHEKLAVKTGIDQSRLSQLEEVKGEAEPSVVRRLAEVFACDPLEFAEVIEEAH